ncbi:MAG: hypothetical protein DRO11_03905 [Methanobacteriota archaeon]|nr:MAG: hypothetical protein DRO11_03905 [Euryarchaeota archaeon]
MFIIFLILTAFTTHGCGEKEEGVVVTGKLVNKATGLGVAGATIHFYLLPIPGEENVASPFTASTQTNVDGLFEVSLPPGSYVLVVDEPELLPIEKLIHISRERENHFEVETASANRVAGRIYDAHTGLSLRGMVSTFSGSEPVEMRRTTYNGFIVGGVRYPSLGGDSRIVVVAPGYLPLTRLLPTSETPELYHAVYPLVSLEVFFRTKIGAEILGKVSGRRVVVEYFLSPIRVSQDVELLLRSYQRFLGDSMVLKRLPSSGQELDELQQSFVAINGKKLVGDAMIFGTFFDELLKAFEIDPLFVDQAMELALGYAYPKVPTFQDLLVLIAQKGAIVTLSPEADENEKLAAELVSNWIRNKAGRTPQIKYDHEVLGSEMIEKVIVVVGRNNEFVGRYFSTENYVQPALLGKGVIYVQSGDSSGDPTVGVLSTGIDLVQQQTQLLLVAGNTPEATLGAAKVLNDAKKFNQVVGGWYTLTYFDGETAIPTISGGPKGEEF